MSIVGLALLLVLVADVALVVTKRLSWEVGAMIGVITLILMVSSFGILK